MCKAILAALLIAFTASAQTPAPDNSLTFEVASIKPSQMPTPDAGGRILIRGPRGAWARKILDASTIRS